MNICGMLLRMVRWTVKITVPDYPKVIICVAPHTSNWDFILGKLAYGAVGRKAGFMMKASWFFFPIGLIFKSIGGIPVSRKGSTSLVDTMVRRFGSSTRLAVAITPEGTRSRTTKWRTGFLRIAYEAHVPIVLGVIDYKTKSIMIETTFNPTGDTDRDMRSIKDFYKGFSGKYPENFSTE